MRLLLGCDEMRTCPGACKNVLNVGAVRLEISGALYATRPRLRPLWRTSCQSSGVVRFEADPSVAENLAIASNCGSRAGCHRTPSHVVATARGCGVSAVIRRVGLPVTVLGAQATAGTPETQKGPPRAFLDGPMRENGGREAHGSRSSTPRMRPSGADERTRDGIAGRDALLHHDEVGERGAVRRIEYERDDRLPYSRGGEGLCHTESGTRAVGGGARWLSFFGEACPHAVVRHATNGRARARYRPSPTRYEPIPDPYSGGCAPPLRRSRPGKLPI